MTKKSIFTINMMISIKMIILVGVFTIVGFCEGLHIGMAINNHRKSVHLGEVWKSVPYRKKDSKDHNNNKKLVHANLEIRYDNL